MSEQEYVLDLRLRIKARPGGKFEETATTLKAVTKGGYAYLDHESIADDVLGAVRREVDPADLPYEIDAIWPL